MFAMLFAAALALPAHSSVARATAVPPAHAITGRVTDPSGVPLPEVRVSVLEARRSTSTDDSGRYRILELPSGRFTVSFASIGHKPVTRLVTLVSADVTLDVTMEESLVELDAVQVTATPSATDMLASPQPTASRSGEELAEVQAPSLGATLQGMPGVRSWSTGAGIGKPVIRGLTSNRVLVLDDGQRLETQQWGDEHGPNIETADADRIEVIRGPASVLYGSDALGGVVNVVRPDLPDAIGRSGFVHGGVTGSYTSGNAQPDGAFSLHGATGGLGFRASVSGRRSGDVHTPTYTLWNSGNQAIGGDGALGYRGSWGSLTLSGSHRAEHIQMTDPDSAATPNQRIGTDVARAELALPLGSSRLEVTTGWERSRRREFEDDTTSTVGLGLLQQTWTTDVHFHHAPLGRFSGILGFSGVHTGFTKFGEETLVPDSRANNAGLYAFEQTDAGRWSFSGGIRYDYRRLSVDDDTVIGVAAQQRTYNSLTGNLGALYRISEPVALVLNVGRGFRAPSSFELFANGVHEGTVAFEHGNPDLKNETSLNTDVALRVRTTSLSAEVGGFVNLIQNYIYTVPTGTVDTASGFQIFDATQGDARLVGAESAVEYHPLAILHLQGTADYVIATNTTTGDPLPSMPPLRVTYVVRLEPRGAGVVQSPYLELRGETNARQTRLDPAEAQFYADAFGGTGYRSSAYSLLSVGAGVVLAAGSTALHLSLSVQNLLNRRYAEFLSRIKTNAPDPGMGRSLIARIAADF
jgi:iron complex outermembrane receptor protein